MADLTAAHLNWLEQRLRAGGFTDAEITDRLVQAQQHAKDLEKQAALPPWTREPYGAVPAYQAEPDQPMLGPGESGLTATVRALTEPPPVEELAKRPEALPRPPARRDVMPTVRPPAAVAPAQMYMTKDEEGRTVFTNVPGAGATPLGQGLEDWKRQAMEQEGQRASDREWRRFAELHPSGTYTRTVDGVQEDVTVVPRDPYEGRMRRAPGTGSGAFTTGDFRVRAGRGGFTPSAPVPTAGTISQEEYQALTPGQQRAYDEQFAKFIARTQAQMEVDPLAAYNRAATHILQNNPEVRAKFEAYKAELDKLREDEQMTEELYNAALSGYERRLVNEAMMGMGVAASSLDPRTHMRTGVMGF